MAFLYIVCCHSLAFEKTRPSTTIEPADDDDDDGTRTAGQRWARIRTVMNSAGAPLFVNLSLALKSEEASGVENGKKKTAIKRPWAVQVGNKVLSN